MVENSADEKTQTGGQVAERETRLALKNTAQLGLSILGTAVVAVFVRVWLPRVLGPESFGQLHFAESLAELIWLFATLGFDVYVRKEAASKISDAERYFGGFMVVRALLSVLLAGVMALTLYLMGKPPSLWSVAFLFAGVQLATLTSDSLASLMHAAGRVTWLAVSRIVLKLVWAVGMWVAISISPTVLAAAVVYFAAAALKAFLYARLVRRQLNFQFRVDLKSAFVVAGTTLGYFINYLVHRVYERIDVQMLTVLGNDDEVGYYGAAGNIALAGLLLIPLINSVVLPMGARIGATDQQEMSRVMRDAVRMLFVIGLFPALMLVLHAKTLVALLFGEPYAPTAMALGTLGFVLPLTYIAVLTSTHLIQLDRVWTATRISIAGLVLNPVLNYFAIRWGLETFGAGGGGFGAALASLITEVSIVGMMLAAMGRRAVDGKLVRTVLVSGLIVAGITLVHQRLADWKLWLVPLEVMLYLGGGVLLGAIKPSEVRGLLRR